MAVDFDALNRATRDYNRNRPVRFDSDNGRMGMSPQEFLAYQNNQTYRAHNGCYPERPYGPYGTYSTGRR